MSWDVIIAKSSKSAHSFAPITKPDHTALISRIKQANHNPLSTAQIRLRPISIQPRSGPSEGVCSKRELTRLRRQSGIEPGQQVASSNSARPEGYEPASVGWSAPTNDTVYVALVEAQTAATTEYVIEWAGGPVAWVKHAFRDAATRASLVGVTPHVLRQTAVTWMPQAGVGPWKTAGLVGTTVEMVQQVYGHYHPEHLRDAARALG